MPKKNHLFGFRLHKNHDYIEIGGGEGELTKNLYDLGFNIVLFIEPDQIKYEKAQKKLKNVNCLNINIKELDLDNIDSKSNCVTIIMQDVIEHIEKLYQKEFFINLQKKYKNIYFIGRTPNLKSPFGLRNSFGDNTHLYRFTNSSLKEFLKDLGFTKNLITCEPYRITGITSTLRYIPYVFSIGLISIMFVFVFGSWEGFLTPNLVFYSKSYKH